MFEVWPALLVAGVSFAIPQFLVSNYHGPWLVDIIAAACSMLCLALFLKWWRSGATSAMGQRATSETSMRIAVMPWVILVVVVFAWGTPQVKGFLNHLSEPLIPIPGLDKMVQRVPPVVAPNVAPEAAVFRFSWLSASGTAILIAAVLSGLMLGYSVRDLARRYRETVVVVWRSLLTISAMMALGFTTRYSGEDAILGLAFAHTGFLYPFFGTMLGWLGVALTGSDTSSNVLFGSLQRITAEKLGLSPVLMAAANSSGGVMGKMIDAQSIVVASTATKYVGHEWRILRFVFFHSIVLASLVGLLVLLQQYVFTGMIVR
jgi:lactate permease